MVCNEAVDKGRADKKSGALARLDNITIKVSYACCF